MIQTIRKPKPLPDWWDEFTREINGKDFGDCSQKRYDGQLAGGLPRFGIRQVMLMEFLGKRPKKWWLISEMAKAKLARDYASCLNPLVDKGYIERKDITYEQAKVQGRRGNVHLFMYRFIKPLPDEIYIYNPKFFRGRPTKRMRNGG
jgi:hypothetical protein